MNVLTPKALPMAAVTPTICGLCGHCYSESAHTGCESCPLNDSCLMTCCPNCGYSAPDPANSKLLAAARRIGRLGRGASRRGEK